MAIKDEIKQESIKLKDMPPKKKAEYIWEYYKIPIIGVIAAIIFIVTFTRDYRINKRPYFLDAIVINSDIAYSADNYLLDDYIKYAGVDTKTYNIAVDTSIYIDEEKYDQMTMANSQKVMALFSAGELDVVMGPDSIMDQYGRMEAFMDLKEVLDDERIKELEDAGFEMYYTTVYEEDDNGNLKPEGTYLAGVYLDSSKYLKSLEGGVFKTVEESGKRPVFAIAARSQRVENALKFLSMMTGVD